MWHDKLKELGVNVHVIATGAGAGFQNELWEVPGSSAYLSGASFPYAPEEQEELLGFMPEHFCSEEAAIDLASAAYMKAYKFGGKNPVGVGLTASVASEKIHRGEHRAFVCAITNDKVWSFHLAIEKAAGVRARTKDGLACNDLMFYALQDVLNISSFEPGDGGPVLREYKDNTALARERFFLRPFFSANGKRLDKLPDSKRYAIMPGAYNPPHEGHFGTVQNVMDEYNYRVAFEITAEPPHKAALSVQELLQRAKSLNGCDRLFTRKEPFYLDKARAYPGHPLVLGADAMVRMLDPKWGLDILQMFKEFDELDTFLLVAGRTIGDKFVTRDDILESLKPQYSLQDWSMMGDVMHSVSGRYDISSTELRSKL